MPSSRRGWRPPALRYGRCGARRWGWTKSPRCKLSPMTEMCCCSATYEESVSLGLGCAVVVRGVVDHEEDEVFGAKVRLGGVTPVAADGFTASAKQRGWRGCRLSRTDPDCAGSTRS